MTRPFSIDDVVRATGARWTRALPTGSAPIAGVSTDTRSLGRGDLFVALSGPNHDGNAFAAAALEAGAAALVLRAGALPEAAREASVPVLEVADPLAALGDLAAWYRSGIDAPVIGVTGSSGKTSTKDALLGVLGRFGPVSGSRASFNNSIGVPLTLLATPADARALCVEVGTNAPGEIADLCRLARPTDGIVTGIGSAHLEGLGSRRGIAEEKGALPEALPSGGVCVLPRDDEYFRDLAERTSARVVTFGDAERTDRADVLVDDVRALDGTEDVALAHGLTGPGTAFRLRGPLIEGERVVAVPLLGHHAARNVAAALACALAHGHDLDALLDGARELVPAQGRLLRRAVAGVTLLDDTYNANPDSVRAALRVLAGWPARGRRILVLGEMLELGESSAVLHREVGREAAGVDLLVAVGERAWPALEGAVEGGLDPRAGLAVKDRDRAREVLRAALAPGDVLLAKGSRGAALERLLAVVAEDLEAGEPIGESSHAR